MTNPRFRLPFALRLAIRESRASGRRLAVYMGAITIGVAALVAINSFRRGVAESVTAESKALLGADARLSSGRAFPDSVQAVVDSVVAADPDDVTRVVATLSVALAPNDNTRLVQVRAVEPGYPFYGEVTTEPAGLWPTLANGRDAIVESSLLIALDASVGDTLRIGQTGFRIAGTFLQAPLEVGFRSALAPRVYFAARWLDEAELIGFGSIVTYLTYLRIPAADAIERFEDRYHDRFRRNLVNFTTAREEADDLTDSLEWMARFLGLVGLAALLLGGLGVASAVHVFVREKRAQVAVLRCIGATRRTAFIAYLLQSALLGFGGALVGAVLGVAAQAVLPALIGAAIPVSVPFRIYWREIALGIGVGLWVATVFALLPLLAIRAVSPLQALRHDVEPSSRRIDPWVVATWLAIAASIVVLGIMQAPETEVGFGFAAGLAGAALALRGVAWVLMRGARRLFPKHAAFAVRQGISGLFRPSNQTAAVTIALGFGVFLVATIWIVQSNLLDRFALDSAGDAPDLVAFDIQPQQRDSVIATFERVAGVTPGLVALVPARIAAINDMSANEILSGPRVREIEPWAVRREYRHTYRDSLTASERLTRGEWFSGEREPGSPVRVSVEESLMQSLDLSLGDRITWNLQGVEIESVITSVRTVDWARFETNFFVVFEPGSIDDAPQSFVTFARVPDERSKATIQRDLARAWPNVSTLDISLVQQTFEDIIGRVTLAIRFMAIFAVAAGLLVMAGAISAGRFQRAREAILLRTLGAKRDTVRTILLTEYAALGSLAGLSGVLLACIAGWACVRFLFELEFRLPVLPLLVAWAGIALLAILIGTTGNRSLLDRPPLEALREAE
jgi:putative ABC transport system permease protein